MGEKTFARYLNHLDERGELQDRHLFDEMWSALRRVLRRELSRRDLWRLPPGYLGIYGVDSWNDEAFDDLAQDCYLFAIHERRRALIAQAKVRGDIYGLVVRNVRNFLYETQRRNDPLGFRVFELLQLTARKCVAAECLHVVTGDSRIRNNTIMEFLSENPSSENPPTAEPEHLADVAIYWCDELLPDLVTVRGPAVHDCVKRLRRLMHSLPEEGIRRFRFGDLVDSVKSEARRRWTAIGSMDLPVVNPVLSETDSTSPSFELIEMERYRSLLDGLEQAVKTWRGRRATREYLDRLLAFLCHHAAEADHPGRLPSSRWMSESLSIPRERFKDLFATLRRMTEETFESDELPPPGRLSTRIFDHPKLNERASP